MKTKMIFLLIASLIVITACAGQFQQPVRKPTPVPEIKTTPTESIVTEEEPAPLQQTTTQQQIAPSPKKTEAECKKQWQVLTEAKSSFIAMEKGVVELFFKEGITLADAQRLLKNYQLKFKEVKTIFPTKEQQSAEKLFSTYRRIVAEVQPGKEIEVGCKTMQEESIESISPVLKVDINALVKK